MFISVRAVLQLRRATWPSALSGSRAIGLPSQSPSAGSQASACPQAGHPQARRPRGRGSHWQRYVVGAPRPVPEAGCGSRAYRSCSPIMTLTEREASSQSSAVCRATPRLPEQQTAGNPDSTPDTWPRPCPSHLLSGNGSCSCSPHHGLSGFCKAGRHQPPASRFQATWSSSPHGVCADA